MFESFHWSEEGVVRVPKSKRTRTLRRRAASSAGTAPPQLPGGRTRYPTFIFEIGASYWWWRVRVALPRSCFKSRVPTSGAVSGGLGGE